MAKLFVVGTPIGNLGDISPRAAETLRMADVIACEDTRHSRPLLEHIGAKGRTVAYHKFNETECARKIADMVHEGKNVALITDAGMPSVSDPGAEVVALCRREGIAVEKRPRSQRGHHCGRPLRSEGEGIRLFGFFAREGGGEEACGGESQSRLPSHRGVCRAPRCEKLAAELGELLGDRTVYAVREMTKLHECVTRSTLLSFECEERGEIVLVIEGAEEESEYAALSPEEHLARYLAEGMDKKEAVKRVAAERGVPRNEIYRLTL